MMKRWMHGEGKKTAIALLLLAATPFTAFFLMQWIYAGSLSVYPLYVLWGNGVCLAFVYYLFVGLTGRLLLGSLLTHLAAGILGAANYFVASFRGNPVLPWDLTALGTAAAVSGTYRYRLTAQMILALMLAAGAAGLLFWFRKKRFLCLKNWWLRGGLLCAGLLCLRPVIQPEILEQWGITTDVWDQQGAYRSQGVLASFLCNTRFMEVEKPAGYSPRAYQNLLGRARTDHTEGLGEQNPHIIAIMNESWADFEEFGNLSLNDSVMDEIRSLNGIFGHAYTSVFGAGTSASEFEFLTGNSMAFLPSGSIPYQQYLGKSSESLASILSGYGYDCLAMHPGERTSWQRNLAYPKLGFDNFKCEEDLDVPVTTEHGYISDATSFEQIIWEFEQKEPGQPLFLFNVTIQNHGSYTVADYPAEVTVTDYPGQFPKAEQYLTLANKSDEAFQMLVDYFSTYEEPTIILMFGDHQPSVEQEFLDLVYNVGDDGMSMEEYMRKYEVPYLIWANYDLPQMELPTTSLNFLGQQLLRLAGIETTGYGEFLWGVQEILPAICFPGYTDAEGNAYSHLETNDFTPLIDAYQSFQYNNLFGGEDRLDALYEPELSAEAA